MIDDGGILACAPTELMERARAVAGAGPVSFSPKVFVPLTKLCRDVCHYCTFAQPPRRGERAYMTADEVLAVARAGRDAGCHEALFTLGDKPELRYRAAREELRELGCESTLEYLARMCALVLEETGLLPHVNPGVMSSGDLAALRPVSASMGLMLETVSERLAARGGPHHGSPDKRPEVRLATLEAAGELAIPMTTGILIGIGETRAERLAALRAIAAVHARHGHVQEVIVQNFRAKPGTLMAAHPEPDLAELQWTASAARLILPADVHLQCPPNLSERFEALLDAGIDDWGGISPVTVDHVNPEAPWPDLDRLAAATESRDRRLVARLALYPERVAELDRWVDPAVAPRVLARADAEGWAREDGWAAGVAGAPVPPSGGAGRVGSGALAAPVAEALARSRAGAELDEDGVVALFAARGADFRAVCAHADQLRREACGDGVAYVVTRNINYTNVCYFRCGFCAFSKGRLAENLRGPAYVVPLEEIVRRCVEASERGAVEVCLQGGIHPGFDGDYYVSVCEAIKRELPDLHVHAFSALEVWQGAATLGVGLDAYLRRLRQAGLASLPGTAAEILDDEVRRVLCPDKIDTAQWLEVHDAAHRAGLRSTATIMFGAVEGPRAWARHLLHVREQQRRTGGFTEFVPLPFVHMEAPIFRRGRARPGPTFREAVLMHAVARIALHPLIPHVQASWVKLGEDGARAALAAGADDLGGTLMNESISRAAGAAHGQEMPPERMESLIRSAGRVPRQRTTFYGTPPPERTAASYGAAPLAPPIDVPAREARLRRPARLVRPVGSGGSRGAHRAHAS
jgi:FO synthase